MKYAIPGIPTLMAFLAWIGERLLEEKYSRILAGLPLEELLMMTLAVLLGIFYADSFNPNSPLRRTVAKWQKLADVPDFVLASVANSNSSGYEAVLHVRFVKVLSNVICTLEVTQYVHLPHAKSSFVIQQKDFERTEENLVVRFVVARFPRRQENAAPVGYPSWGERDSHPWAGDGSHVVTLKMRSGLRNQTMHFLIVATKNASGGEPVILFGGSETQAFLEIHP